MTCNCFTPPPMTLREATDLISPGVGHEWPGVAADDLPRGMGQRQLEAWLRDRKRAWDHAHSSTESIAPPGPMFMCGGGLIIPVCACGTQAEYLCDYPVGKGKTCDLNLCVHCRFALTPEKDLCSVHRAQVAGVERVNPWPPPRRTT